AEAEGQFDLGPAVGDEGGVRWEGDAHPADRLSPGTVVSRDAGGVCGFLEQGDDAFSGELPAVLGVDGAGEHQLGPEPGRVGSWAALEGLGQDRVRLREPTLKVQ